MTLCCKCFVTPETLTFAPFTAPPLSCTRSYLFLLCISGLAYMHMCNGILGGVRGQRGDRKIQGQGRQKMRPGIEPRSQELASCAMTARPPQHDTTGPRHRAFDVFQGSSYNMCSSLVVGSAGVCLPLRSQDLRRRKWWKTHRKKSLP